MDTFELGNLWNYGKNAANSYYSPVSSNFQPMQANTMQYGPSQYGPQMSPVAPMQQQPGILPGNPLPAPQVSSFSIGQNAGTTGAAGAAANPMSAFQMQQQNQMLQSMMPRDYWGNPMGMTQDMAKKALEMGMLPEGFDISGLPMEHGFMDKMGGMKGLMGIGQLGMTGMGIYNSFKQMQLQKDMFNKQANMMDQNLAMQKKTINNKYRDQENNRGSFMGGVYDADAAYEKKKLT